MLPILLFAALSAPFFTYRLVFEYELCCLVWDLIHNARVSDIYGGYIRVTDFELVHLYTKFGKVWHEIEVLYSFDRVVHGKIEILAQNRDFV